nr:MAG TPA: hypothetical protein [Caudoviricetes sp.]
MPGVEPGGSEPAVRAILLVILTLYSPADFCSRRLRDVNIIFLKE